MPVRYCIDMLMGCQLTRVGRCADLIWWEFRGDGTDYVLHTQCACRLLLNGISLLTRSSIYFEPDENSSESETLFDRKINQEISLILPITVQRITCNATNDLMIIGSNDVCVEIFADNPGGIEQWRFFTPGRDEPHLVAYCGYIEYE